MDVINSAYWIEMMALQPHPEGGFYKEVYRSDEQVSRTSSTEVRQACTSIYYLLQDTDFSGFHRLKSDELWYFHKGVPLHVHVIDEEGNYTLRKLSDTYEGNFSIAVKAGCWFASEIPSKRGYALVSCAVAPGFEFSEFEMAKKDVMIAQYPAQAALLSRLCRE